MSTDSATDRRQPVARPAFTAIACGIDDTPATEVAVHQAAALAGPGGTIELIACLGSNRAQTSQLLLSRSAAQHALRGARAIATDAGVHVTPRIIEPGWERHPLLDAAREHDLLVLGSHEDGRALGILGAGVMTGAVHRAPCPVLVARPCDAFPGQILLADDGTHESGEAARLAAAIAAQHGSEVLVAAPPELDAPRRHRLAEDMTTLAEATGREPVAVDVEGPAARVLPVLATRLEAGLLVLGSRRLKGPRALGSVSERVAHAAPCSVLIVRD